MKNKYEYIAIHVDDLLTTSENPQQIIHDLKEKFKLKIKGDGPLEYQTLVVTTNEAKIPH